MAAGLNALLCGFLGVVSAHVVYVQSNLFIVRDAIRPGRHPLYDPLAFDGLGLLWGLAVGALCVVWLGATHPAKTIFLGLGITLTGVLAFGGISTWQRYQALPLDPQLQGGPLELQFELRLPPGRDVDTGLPDQGHMGSGPRNTVHAKLEAKSVQHVEGCLVLSGRISVRSAEPEQLLQFDDPVWGWVAFDVVPGEVQHTEEGAWSGWIVPTNAHNNPGTEYDFRLRYRMAR